MIILRKFHYAKLTKPKIISRKSLVSFTTSYFDKLAKVKYSADSENIYFKEDSIRKEFRKQILTLNKKITSLILKKSEINKIKKKNISDLEFYNSHISLLNIIIMKIIESPFDDEYKL